MEPPRFQSLELQRSVAGVRVGWREKHSAGEKCCFQETHELAMNASDLKLRVVEGPKMSHPKTDLTEIGPAQSLPSLRYLTKGRSLVLKLCP